MAINRNTLRTAIVATAALSLSACATKDFGRMETPRNLAAMNCAELAEQHAAVDAFRARVDDKSDFDGRSVAAVWIDFGIGNHRDKKRALASAAAYEGEVAAAQRALGCG